MSYTPFEEKCLKILERLESEQSKKLDDVLLRVTRIETKMEVRCNSQVSSIIDHDKRLRNMEMRETYRRGMVAVIAVIGGFAGTLITGYAKQWLGF